MTSLPAGYRAVDVPESRRLELLELTAWAFPGKLSAEQMAELPLPVAFDRARGIECDGELVAFHSSYPFSDFPVPGARTAVSGLTWVGVHPGHRRRGLLAAMIDDHFARSLGRGEAVSALFAAEPAIYGRFGYGMAATDVRMKIPRGAALRDVPGAEVLRVRMERLDPDRHAPIVQAVHSAVERPGWSTRQTPELLAAHVADPEAFRDGAESMRIAVVAPETDPGTPLGYALFRRKNDWKDEGPRGSVWVQEAVAQDAATARALWGVLVDLDLMGTIEAWLLAPDDPLTHLLVDPRAALPRIGDNLWVRILDVAPALSARRYATDIDLVLGITDGRLTANTGRWHLTGGPEGAEVTRVDTPPDLSLDVRELGSAYLGGMSLMGLASAGLVTEHASGALRAAAVAFGWPVAPVCSWIW